VSFVVSTHTKADLALKQWTERVQRLVVVQEPLNSKNNQEETKPKTRVDEHGNEFKLTYLLGSNSQQDEYTKWHDYFRQPSNISDEPFKSITSLRNQNEA
jgi:hypothetical protein